MVKRVRLSKSTFFVLIADSRIPTLRKDLKDGARLGAPARCRAVLLNAHDLVYPRLDNRMITAAYSRIEFSCKFHAGLRFHQFFIDRLDEYPSSDSRQEFLNSGIGDGRVSSFGKE